MIYKLCMKRKLHKKCKYCTFSFYTSKVITTGKEDMLVANNDELVDKIRIMRGHGMSSL